MSSQVLQLTIVLADTTSLLRGHGPSLLRATMYGDASLVTVSEEARVWGNQAIF